MKKVTKSRQRRPGKHVRHSDGFISPEMCFTAVLIGAKCAGFDFPWLVCAMPLTIGALIRLFVTLEKI